MNTDDFHKEWIKRAEEWRINAEEKRNHLKTAESTLAAREGEIERIRGQLLSHERMAAAGVYVETEKYSGMVVQISTLQAELATAQSENEKLSDQVSDLADERDKYANTILSLRSQLTEAQEWRNEAEGQLIESGKLISDLSDKLTEAQAKLAKLNPLGLE